MRLAILSDIHANLEALQATLGDVSARGVNRVVCLGDIVGYNADPAPCVALLREIGALCVAIWKNRFADAALGWALRLGMTLSLVGAASAGFMVRPTAEQLAAAHETGRLTVAGAHTVGAADGGPGLPGTNWSLEHGDLRIAHCVGLHALQAFPALALIKVNSGWFHVSDSFSTRMPSVVATSGTKYVTNAVVDAPAREMTRMFSAKATPLPKTPRASTEPIAFQDSADGAGALVVAGERQPHVLVVTVCQQTEQVTAVGVGRDTAVPVRGAVLRGVGRAVAHVFLEVQDS